MKRLEKKSNIKIRVRSNIYNQNKQYLNTLKNSCLLLGRIHNKSRFRALSNWKERKYISQIIISV